MALSPTRLVAKFTLGPPLRCPLTQGSVLTTGIPTPALLSLNGFRWKLVVVLDAFDDGLPPQFARRKVSLLRGVAPPFNDSCPRLYGAAFRGGIWPVSLLEMYFLVRLRGPSGSPLLRFNTGRQLPFPRFSGRSFWFSILSYERPIAALLFFHEFSLARFSAPPRAPLSFFFPCARMRVLSPSHVFLNFARSLSCPHELHRRTFARPQRPSLSL